MVFVIFASFSNNSEENIELLSSGHIWRIVFAFGILFLTINFNSLFLKKMFITLLPVSVLYFGLVFSSILKNINNVEIQNTLSFQSMTSIAFFPLIEIMVNKYYLISPNQSFSIIRIPTSLFKLIIKLITLFIVFTYLFYLLTQ
jgi:hypothetical protein